MSEENKIQEQQWPRANGCILVDGPAAEAPYIECGGCKTPISGYVIKWDGFEANCPNCDNQYRRKCTPSGGAGHQADVVNHPKHYNTGKIEVLEIIEDQKLNFNKGNAVKYICRAGHKGDYVEDLQKAIFYLRREIELQKEKPCRPNEMSEK